MKQKTETLLTVMHVLSWIAVIGILIEGGAILISYSVSISNPEGAKNLYQGLDLYNLRQYDFWNYTAMVSVIVALLAMKAYIAFKVIR